MGLRRSGKRNRFILAVLALFAVAQGIWLAAEFADDRTRRAERAALVPRAQVPPALRQEADSAVRYLSYVRSQAEVVLKERIRERVDEAVSIAASIHRHAQGKVPPATIRQLVREGLRSPRFFDGRGYYFIDDLDGNCVLLPTAPAREGTSLADNRDDTGTYIMRELIRAAQQPAGAGYVRYRWFAPRSAQRMEEKITYVRLFPQLGWLIGTGDYPSMVEEDLKVDALKRLRSVSFPVDGSLVVIDEAGIVRLFRDAPGIEGLPLEAIADGPERRALEAIRGAAAAGHDSARYQWTAASTGRAEARVAWVARAATWGWTVAAVSAAPPVVAADGDGLAARQWWRFGLPAALLLLTLAATMAAAAPPGDDGSDEPAKPPGGGHAG